MSLSHLYPNLVNDSHMNIGNDSPQGFPLASICPGTVHLLSGSAVVLKLPSTASPFSLHPHIYESKTRTTVKSPVFRWVDERNTKQMYLALDKLRCS